MYDATLTSKKDGDRMNASVSTKFAKRKIKVKGQKTVKKEFLETLQTILQRATLPRDRFQTLSPSMKKSKSKLPHEPKIHRQVGGSKGRSAAARYDRVFA